MNHEDFMRMAIHEALVALEHSDVPIGAVLVRNGEVVAKCHNDRELTGLATGHAELSAIKLGCERLGDWRLMGCDLYVTLEPCPMCAGAIVAARISRLIFGAWDPKSGACGSLYNIAEDPRLNHSVEVIRGVLPDECSQLMSGFFDQIRR